MEMRFAIIYMLIGILKVINNLQIFVTQLLIQFLKWKVTLANWSDILNQSAVTNVIFFVLSSCREFVQIFILTISYMQTVFKQ